MQTITCPTDADLAAFDLGDLRGERYKEVARHLELCDACATRFESLAPQSDAVVENLRRPLPADVLEWDSELQRLVNTATLALNTEIASRADLATERRAAPS